MDIQNTLLLSVAVIGLLACSSNRVRYDVTGVNAPEDKATVYLMDELTSTPIDSAVISSRAFRMKGKAAKDAYLTVSTQGHDWTFMFFNDGKPVLMNYSDSTVTGSQLNTKLGECNKANVKEHAKYFALLDSIDVVFDALPEEEYDARIDEYNSAYRAASKKYHARGLDVVSLSFDEEKEPWVKAITQWEMPWIHLSDLMYIHSVAADVYTVNSIPDNLLIDPQGTIVARSLRGADLDAKLAEIFR